tara:strand:- start:921 stop:2465 length:1545 start_codon:yes stop_codon:yes gene_type:complete
VRLLDQREQIIQHLRTEIAALEVHLDSQNNLLRSLKEQLEGHESREVDERRTQVFRRAARDILDDKTQGEFRAPPKLAIEDMGDARVTLGSRLDHKFAEVRALAEITEQINSGMFFDEVLDQVFECFEQLIPYDRIGVALIETTKAGQVLVRSGWNRSRYDRSHIANDYAAPLAGSSLQRIAETREPRILNDLNAYLRENPDSTSTQLILREGIQSNLTCLLVARDPVIGFIFFSSRSVDTYRDQHVELFTQIAGELALTLEKSRAYEDLYLRNEFIRKVFGKYVTNEVAESVMKTDGPLELGGERCKVTILMADVRGFTPMSERLPPESVVDALNGCLGAMTQVIMGYGGSIDNFIGDAIMAMFGVPITKDDDADRAVACAIEMQNAMVEVNARNAERHLPELAIGIGLNTGEVVAGNIGSEQRMKYSVIGSLVNLAARIESFASGGQVLSSDSTFEEVQNDVQTDGRLNVKLKGIEGTVPIHEIVGLNGDFNVLNNHWQKSRGPDSVSSLPV